MSENTKMRLNLEFPVSGEDYEGDVVLMRDGADKAVFVSPGDSLTIGLSAEPSGKPRIEIDLQIDFREPFSSKVVVVASVVAHVKYMKAADVKAKEG